MNHLIRNDECSFKFWDPTLISLKLDVHPYMSLTLKTAFQSNSVTQAVPVIITNMPISVLALKFSCKNKTPHRLANNGIRYVTVRAEVAPIS